MNPSSLPPGEGKIAGDRNKNLLNVNSLFLRLAMATSFVHSSFVDQPGQSTFQ